MLHKWLSRKTYNIYIYICIQLYSWEKISSVQTLRFASSLSKHAAETLGRITFHPFCCRRWRLSLGRRTSLSFCQSKSSLSGYSTSKRHQNYWHSETKGHSKQVLPQIYQLIALLVSNGFVVESVIFKTNFPYSKYFGVRKRLRGSQFETSWAESPKSLEESGLSSCQQILQHTPATARAPPPLRMFPTWKGQEKSWTQGKQYVLDDFKGLKEGTTRIVRICQRYLSW